MDRTEHVVVTPEQTEVTEGKICFRNTHHPVHGALVEYYGNGQKRSEMMLDHGQRSGPYLIWYAPGQQRARARERCRRLSRRAERCPRRFLLRRRTA